MKQLFSQIMRQSVHVLAIGVVLTLFAAIVSLFMGYGFVYGMKVGVFFFLAVVAFPVAGYAMFKLSWIFEMAVMQPMMAKVAQLPAKQVADSKFADDISIVRGMMLGFAVVVLGFVLFLADVVENEMAVFVGLLLIWLAIALAEATWWLVFRLLPAKEA